jgi:hypothetical protein
MCISLNIHEKKNMYSKLSNFKYRTLELSTFIFWVAQKGPFNINNKGISRSSLVKTYFFNLQPDSDKSKMKPHT